MTWPPWIPPPPKTSDQHSGQWSRPPFGLMCGVRLLPGSRWTRADPFGPGPPTARKELDPMAASGLLACSYHYRCGCPNHHVQTRGRDKSASRLDQPPGQQDALTKTVPAIGVFCLFRLLGKIKSFPLAHRRQADVPKRFMQQRVRWVLLQGSVVEGGGLPTKGRLRSSVQLHQRASVRYVACLIHV